MVPGPFISVIPRPTCIPGVTRRSKFDSMMVRLAANYSTSASEYCSRLLQLTDLSVSRSSILFDSNKTLNARLTQSTVPRPDVSCASCERNRVTPSPEISYSPVSPRYARPTNPYSPYAPPTAAPRPIPASPPPTGRKKKKRPHEVHVTLRRGGR
jgi:hypothetical protein